MSILNPGDWPIDPQVVDGTELADRLNRLKLALYSGNSSSNRPADVAAGGIWVKQTSTGFDLMLYDGTADVVGLSFSNGAAASFLPLAGGTLTGDLTVPQVLASAAQGTAENSLTRKDYVDGEVATRLPLAGGDLTGGLIVGGQLQVGAINKNFIIGVAGGSNFSEVDGVFDFMSSGNTFLNVRPNYLASSTGFDNALYLGLAAQRWREIYAALGTINTSDEREKKDIRPLDEREKAAALRIKGLIRAYRWKDDTIGKGKLYIGVIAQQIKQALLDEGLVAEDYAMWREEAIDEDGNTRFSVDYSQVLAFVIGAL